MTMYLQVFKKTFYLILYLLQLENLIFSTSKNYLKADFKISSNILMNFILFLY